MRIIFRPLIQRTHDILRALTEGQSEIGALISCGNEARRPYPRKLLRDTDPLLNNEYAYNLSKIRSFLYSLRPVPPQQRLVKNKVSDLHW